MTREEAIRLIGWLKCTTNREDDLEAIDMAIEALSADVVSRDVYDKRTKADEEIIDSYRQEFQKALSANTVQGEWIIRENGNKECSLCGHERQDGWDYFCGYCGAIMKGGAE